MSDVSFILDGFEAWYVLQLLMRVTKPRHPFPESKKIRDELWRLIHLARKIHHLEDELVRGVYYIDKKRGYTLFGDYSVRGFCTRCLKFTKNQAQRIAIRVARYQPESNEGGESDVEESDAFGEGSRLGP